MIVKISLAHDRLPAGNLNRLEGSRQLFPGNFWKHPEGLRGGEQFERPREQVLRHRHPSRLYIQSREDGPGSGPGGSGRTRSETDSGTTEGYICAVASGTILGVEFHMSMQELIDRVTADPDFAQRLKEDFGAATREAGIEVSADEIKSVLEIDQAVTDEEAVQALQTRVSHSPGFLSSGAY